MDVKRYCSRFAAGTESYRELTEWYEDGGDDQGTAYVLASDFDALRATVARLEADARRYQGIRRAYFAGDVGFADRMSDLDADATWDEFDASIDAALAEQVRT